MNDKKACFFIAITLFLAGFCSIYGQSIAEKKESLVAGKGDLTKEAERYLFEVNQETLSLRFKIHQLYQQVDTLFESNAPPEDYQALLKRINEYKKEVVFLENSWREMASRSGKEDLYGLWHAPETTIEQLIIDYGSQDYVYLIPADVGALKLSVNSNIPIPRSSWSEMLELILNQNGVAVRDLNPYLKQVYFVSGDNSSIKMITNHRDDLELFPTSTRIAFVVSPEVSEVRRSALFFEKFLNPNTTFLHVLGRSILIIGRISDVQDLLKLYDFVVANHGEKEYRLVPVHKVQVEEMAKILAAMFDHVSENSARIIPATGEGESSISSSSSSIDNNGLKVVILESVAQALFLVGTRDELNKAEEIIHNVENQVGGARDRIVFWYTVRHSNAEELAEVLEKVYNLMMQTGTAMEENDSQNSQNNNVNRETIVINKETPQIIIPQPRINQLQPPPTLYGQEGFYQEGAYVYNPAPIMPGILQKPEVNNDRTNFIVDLKTGSIIMVVEANTLPKLKELLKRLDVPKKMVQIETLLFEKRLSRDNAFGLNLLRIGAAASNTNATGAFFNNIHPINIANSVLGNAGVSEFFMSRKEGSHGPAFDLVYRFLLSQDDIQINSTPTVMTVNQTPAQISVIEDISVNTGIFEVETAKGVTLKDAFTRAQYGITINITPTIHMRAENDDNDCDDADYVTLETDVTFDTIESDINSRPNVTRRHIVNEVQIPDGQSVILGGLRRKTSHDTKESIPFIGELPGIGKLFSESHLRDSSTEMFIFITPHIVRDPAQQLNQLRQDLLCLRPGDTPYFLKCVEDAHRCEKHRLMQGGMSILFGRPQPCFYIEDGEYDGSYDGC
jgi:general secretion pathway protein D